MYLLAIRPFAHVSVWAFLALVITAILPVGFRADASEQQSMRLNVLFLSADDLRPELGSSVDRSAPVDSFATDTLLRLEQPKRWRDDRVATVGLASCDGLTPRLI